MGVTTQFFDQNPLAGETLKFDDVEAFAQHHAGGLVVLGMPSTDGRYVKMHDSWGDEDEVVVHLYDPDNPEDPREVVEAFATGREALARFIALAQPRAAFVEAAIERSKREILADLAEGRFEAQLADGRMDVIECFADLHDYVDANEYGGLCDEGYPFQIGSAEDPANEIQSAVDAWIRAGGMKAGSDV